MNERAAFLRAIADSPADDTARLAFADWLDEHGEAPLAEFVRVQIQLGDAPRYKPPKGIAKLVARENQLLREHQAEWLGPLHELNDEVRFQATFRRGFVSKIVADFDLLAGNDNHVCQFCPLLDELDVLGLQDSAAMEFLTVPAALRTLRLEGWPHPRDARRLAASTEFQRVEHLSVWLGSENDRAVCDALGAAKHMPALKRVELIQLFGGLQAGADAPALDRSADELANVVNKARGASVAAVSRPFADTLPLAPKIGRDLYAGVLPDGRQVLAHHIGPSQRDGNFNFELLYFDAEGTFTGAERRKCGGKVRRKFPFEYKPGGAKHELVVGWLWPAIGFRPATIRVREFEAATFLPGHALTVYKFGRDVFDVFENPDAGDVRREPAGAAREVRRWLRTGQFVVHANRECWADESGTIVAT